ERDGRPSCGTPGGDDARIAHHSGHQRRECRCNLSAITARLRHTDNGVRNYVAAGAGPARCQRPAVEESAVEVELTPESSLWEAVGSKAASNASRLPSPSRPSRYTSSSRSKSYSGNTGLVQRFRKY